MATSLGVTNVSFKLMDARRFRPNDQLFDKILVDAPCFLEGRVLLLLKKMKEWFNAYYEKQRGG